MTRPSLRTRWKAKVYTTGLVSATVKVTLFALAEDMWEDGYASVPMTKMSKRLDTPPRRILAHYQAAVEAGFLARVSRGYEGHTAVYRAQLPDPERVSKTSTLSGFENDTLSPRKRVSFRSTPIESATHPDTSADDYAVALRLAAGEEGGSL